MPLCSSLLPASRFIYIAPFRLQRRQGPGKAPLIIVKQKELKQAVCGHKLHQVISSPFSVFVQMAAELMNRSRGLAEGAVVMVCPVLLALSLDKVDLKVYGRPAFFAMLSMAGITLISGICPLLVCCFSKRFPDMGNIEPAPVTSRLATLSSSCLLILTCFIAQLVVSKQVLIAVGVLCGAFVLPRTVIYYLGGDGNPYSPKLHKVLDESHEFLTGVTGILFLGLEGLALEGHENKMVLKAGPVGNISFIVCALGVCMMYLEMTPPSHFKEMGEIVCFTLTLDSIMACGTFTLLMVVMFKLMGPPALVLFAPPVLIIVELVYRVAVDGRPLPTVHDRGDGQASTPASLELTRVTFTGFLAVSITAIRNTSPSMLTSCFLLFASSAIVFGLSWRLLSQTQIRSRLARRALPDLVASSADLASLCTHFCIVIATILFLAMAGTARGK